MNYETMERWKLVVDEYFMNDFNRTRAYMKIYPKSGANCASIRVYHIFNHPEIKEYIKEKYTMFQENLGIKKEDILEKLELFIAECMDSNKMTNTTLKSIDMINKMMGFYAPEKMDIDHQVSNITINIKKNRDDVE